jgi:hypothetical protein
MNHHLIIRKWVGIILYSMENKFKERILEKLNSDYNRTMVTNVNFHFYEEVLSFAKDTIGEELSEFYGVDTNSDLFFTILEGWVRKNYGNGKMAMPGDDIILIEMSEDPNPIKSGTLGYVMKINTVKVFNEEHLFVDWYNGRKLNVIVGVDKYKVIPKNDIKKFIISYSWL